RVKPSVLTPSTLPWKGRALAASGWRLLVAVVLGWTWRSWGAVWGLGCSWG
ncbi:MAG: hypothetical protein RL456_2128, partial [Pseudomonadota bacterium]